MKHLERAALVIVVLILIVFPASVLAYRDYVSRGVNAPSLKVIDLLARVPERGGWSPDVITVHKGDTVRLRIQGTDVVHGVAIGHTDIQSEAIYPGEVAVVEFVANTPGRFTYYCNVWCSPFHYRMRGVLDVIDENASGQPPDEAWGATATSDVDLDAPHEAGVWPTSPPSVSRGQQAFNRYSDGQLPTAAELEALYQESPSAVYERIRAGESALGAMFSGASLSDEETWDLVAYLWFLQTTPERIARGKALYAQECAACHGYSGRGDGPAAAYAPEEVPDLTDAGRAAGATKEIYRGKILRGGMGTGMPYFGPLFTEEQVESLVDFLWTFLLPYDEE